MYLDSTYLVHCNAARCLSTAKIANSRTIPLPPPTQSSRAVKLRMVADVDVRDVAVCSILFYSFTQSPYIAQSLITKLSSHKNSFLPKRYDLTHFLLMFRLVSFHNSHHQSTTLIYSANLSKEPHQTTLISCVVFSIEGTFCVKTKHITCRRVVVNEHN
jgi:hypothetical protein